MIAPNAAISAALIGAPTNGTRATTLSGSPITSATPRPVILDGNNFISLPPIVICTLSKGVSISNPSVDTDAFLTLWKKFPSF